jgi:hypothetical protein
MASYLHFLYAFMSYKENFPWSLLVGFYRFRFNHLFYSSWNTYRQMEHKTHFPQHSVFVLAITPTTNSRYFLNSIKRLLF